jgi:ATP-dependent DNA helicase RecG
MIEMNKNLGREDNAEILFKSRNIEKWGSGIRRIYEECAANNVKVKFIKRKYGFSVVLYRQERATQKTTQKTTQKILDLIKEKREISRRELAERIGISEEGIKFNLSKLKKKGIIKRIGPDKGGYWEVKNGE